MTTLSREELELAALPAGVELDWEVPDNSPPWRITGSGSDRGPAAPWNPATNADDLVGLYLACKHWCAWREWNNDIAGAYNDLQNVEDDNDSAKWAEAVCRLAVEIGRVMR